PRASRKAIRAGHPPRRPSLPSPRRRRPPRPRPSPPTPDPSRTPAATARRGLTSDRNAAPDPSGSGAFGRAHHRQTGELHVLGPVQPGAEFQAVDRVVQPDLQPDRTGG